MEEINTQQAQERIASEWTRAENVNVSDIRKGTGDVWHAWTEWTIEGEPMVENIRLARNPNTGAIEIL